MSATPARSHRADSPATATRATAPRRPSTPHLPSLVGNQAFASLVLQRCGGAAEPCPCHSGAPPEIQRAPAGGGGLRVGAADDAYEKEAARISAAVLSDPAAGTPVAQRAAGPDADAEFEDDVPDLQAHAHPGGPRPAGGAVTRYVGSLGSGGGQPLPAATRRMLEPRFGRGFGGVRVHHDDAAAAAARAVHASAFTVGSHIVFGSGQYAPSTVAGQALLAHELVHVVQQSGGRGRRVIQRSPWGACPAGKRLPAVLPSRYTAAEYQMLSHYRSQRPYKEVASNIDKFWEINPSSWSGEPARMLRAFKKYYVSHKGPVPRRSVRPAGQVPAPGKGGSALDAIGGAAPAVDFVAVELQPDIIDFRRREIYDVTTTKLAKAKQIKILAYAALATRITGRLWTPGRTLGAPGPFNLVRMHVPGELVCFGATDLARYPGVLAYEVISTKKKAKKKDKKKDKKKKAAKTDSKKKDTKKKDTKKKDAAKAPATKGGNIGFGIGLFSTGGGSGNAALGVSVMSHGTAYGTVSAGVVYNSTGQAVGAVGAGASSGSSSTGIGVAGVGASKDSTSIAAGAAGAGTSSGSTSAAAGVAGAGSSKDDTVAAAGVAGRGSSEGNLAAAAGASGSGDVRGQVGAKAGGGGTTAGTGGTAAGAGGTTAGRGGTATTADGGTGTRQGDGSAGGGTKDGGVAGTPGKYGLPIPGQAAGDVDRAVEQAAQMEALLRTARPAQRALMEGLARKSASGTFTVTGPEWVRFMLSASQDVRDADVPRLLSLEWTPGKITPEELRASIKRVLARKDPPPSGATSATGGKPGKKPGKTPPEQAAQEGKAVRKPLDKQASAGGLETGNKGDQKPKESATDRIARLAERAAGKGPYNGQDSDYIIYDKDAKPNTPIPATLFLAIKDGADGRRVWATADVTAILTERPNGKLRARITASTELVTGASRYVEGAVLRGFEADLERQ